MLFRTPDGTIMTHITAFTLAMTLTFRPWEAWRMEMAFARILMMVTGCVCRRFVAAAKACKTTRTVATVFVGAFWTIAKTTTTVVAIVAVIAEATTTFTTTTTKAALATTGATAAAFAFIAGKERWGGTQLRLQTRNHIGLERIAGVEFDVGDATAVAHFGNRDGQAITPGAACATDAVGVVFGFHG